MLRQPHEQHCCPEVRLSSHLHTDEPTALGCSRVKLAWRNFEKINCFIVYVVICRSSTGLQGVERHLS